MNKKDEKVIFVDFTMFLKKTIHLISKIKTISLTKNANE